MTVAQGNQQLSLGYSPCPNDTYIFHALVHGELGNLCAGFLPATLADVETLNSWALDGRLDVSKISFHALGHVADRYVLLSAGAALGRGCGPLLVARPGFSDRDLENATVAIPGQYTTAAMLLRLFAPGCRRLLVSRYDQIMPAVASGQVDAGVIIHESRFTYSDQGLQAVCDLGAWWEEETGHPIPLGGIVARRSLGAERIARIDDCIRRSLRWAHAHPAAGLDYIRQHAQELDDRVIQDHIGLYVNPFSDNLGADGLAAVAEFLGRGSAAGIFPVTRPDFAFPQAEIPGSTGDKQG